MIKSQVYCFLDSSVYTKRVVTTVNIG